MARNRRQNLLLFLLLLPLLPLLFKKASASGDILVDCPSGWLSPPSSTWCFFFAQSSSSVRSFEEANAACQTQHGVLASVADEGERSWILKVLSELGEFSEKSWWLGLSRETAESNWVWLDGGKGGETPGEVGDDGKILTWQPGADAGSSGNCMTIQQNNDDSNRMYVMPNDCKKKFKFICKKVKKSITACDASNGWNLHENLCYKLFTNGTSAWNDAQQSCQSQESHLASIHTESVNSIVRDLSLDSEGKPARLWLGLRTAQTAREEEDGDVDAKRATNEFKYEWRWSDGKVGLNFEAWESGQRPNVTAAEVNDTCVHTVGNNAEKLWRRSSCLGDKFGYLCQREAGQCADGWVRHGDMCYEIRTQELSWDEASSVCQSQGAELLELRQRHIQSFVDSRLQDFANAKIDAIWIGIFESASDSSPDYKWQSGASVNSGFVNWDVGQPDSPNDGHDKAGRISISGAGVWQIDRVESLGGFICEIGLGQVPIVTTTVPPILTCPSRWLSRSSSCYLLVRSSVDWLTAENNCMQNYPGSTLVDIRDSSEQEFVQKMLRWHSYPWIGLHARSTDSNEWVWSVDNSRVAYENWETGQPSDKEKNCAMMYTRGRWGQESCASKLYYICKRPANIDGSTPSGLTTRTTARPIDPICGIGWTRNPINGYCYMIVETAMTFLDSAHQCQFNGGELLSIVSQAEKSFVSALTATSASNNPAIVAFWTGLNRRNSESTWRWSDNEAAVFFNWAVGQPAADDDTSECSTLSTDGSAAWTSVQCSRRYSSVCKKLGRSATQQPEQPTTTIAVPDGHYGGCPDGYSLYTVSRMCYRVYTDRLSWYEAQKRCRLDGGDLTSILHAGEEMKVRMLATETAGDATIWLGLRDTLKSGRTKYFEWSDEAEATFVNWDRNQPDFYSSEACVAADGKKSHRWLSISCSQTLQFVCKRQQLSIPGTPPPTTPPLGCSSPFTHAFDNFCLAILQSDSSIAKSDASNRCAKLNGQLASVVSRDVQAFVDLMLRDQQPVDDVWFGLTRSHHTYRWDDGRPVTFTNWAVGGSRGGNVGYVNRQDGKWRMTRSSRTQLKNFLCQSPMRGVTTATTVTTDAVFCHEGWTEADGRCYRAFNEYWSDRVSWVEARHKCRVYGGELASIHSEETVNALSDAMSRGIPYWIGLNTRDAGSGFVWSDGSAANFFRWPNDEQPENVNGNQNCVFASNTDNNWLLDTCGAAKSFICQLDKGANPSTTASPSVTTPPDGLCDPNWKYHDGRCFLFSSRTLTTWHSALRECRDTHGADLASLHSVDDNDFVVSAVSKLSPYGNQYWVGLNELGHTGGFRWSDGTAVDFQNWNPGEPNDWEGAEHCVSLYSTNGFWNDEQCGISQRFVCAKPANGTSGGNGTATTTALNLLGNCPKEFSRVNNRCFRVFKEPRLTWKEASQKCIELLEDRRSFLTSVSNEMEQSALISLTSTINEPLWIGMYTRNYGHQYYWIDNSDVTYDNWDYNEPSGFGDSCVEMHTDRYRAGRWNNNNCLGTRGFVCSTFVDSSLSTEWPAPTEVACPTGWSAYKTACYRLKETRANWLDAATDCRRDGGDLASVHSVWEQAFVHRLVMEATAAAAAAQEDTTAWLGLSDRDEKGTYTWSNNWPVTFTNWASGEPSNPDSSSSTCVSVDSDRGGWRALNCSHHLRPLCRISRGQQPTTRPQSPGVCPTDVDFVPFGANCYHFVVDSLVFGDTARLRCRQLNSVLVSILDEAEHNFLIDEIRQRQQSSSLKVDFWIGLERESDGSFVWLDNSPFSYTSWSGGEPSNTEGENCVEMYQSSMKWNDHYCSKRNAFVCKTPKLPNTATTTGMHSSTIASTRASTRSSTIASTRASTRASTGASSTEKVQTSTRRAEVGEHGGIKDPLRNDGLIAAVIICILLILVSSILLLIFIRHKNQQKDKQGSPIRFSNIRE